MKFPAKLPAGFECPDCGSRDKRYPPSRGGQAHVFCEQCGYDFGRLDTLTRKFTHMLDELERKLGVSPTPH